MDRKTVRSIVENIYRRIMNEGVFEDTHDSDFEDDLEDDEELSPIEEYEKDYPNSRFSPDIIGEDELVEYCTNNDFLFLYKNPFVGWKISNANSQELKDDVLEDIMNSSSIERTHEVDSFFSRYEEWFEDFYIVVFKICGTKDGDYYVIYMEEK